MLKFAVVLLVWLIPELAFSQGYPLVPFQCPAGQSAYSFNPNMGGTGWGCQPTPGSSGISGAFTCPTFTVVNGIITSITNGTCTTFPSSVLLVGGDSTSCILIGGDSTSCLLVGGD